MKPATPTQCRTSYPSISASESQSLAAPSESANAITMTPMARVRGSRQGDQEPAAGLSRVLLLRGEVRRGRAPGRQPRPAPRRPARAAAAARAAPPSGCRSAAPANAPKLQPAWKRGMIVRPSWRSTSAASTFIETSQVAMPTPSMKRPTAASAIRSVDDADHGDGQPDGDQHRAEPGHRGGAEPVDQPAAERQRDHRADRDREQQQAERARCRGRGRCGCRAAGRPSSRSRSRSARTPRRPSCGCGGGRTPDSVSVGLSGSP